MNRIVAVATENLNPSEAGVPITGLESTDRPFRQEVYLRGEHHGTREVDDPESQRVSGLVE